VSGTVDLQSPLPDLNNSIAIQGPGASSLTVEPAAGASFTSAIVTFDAGQTSSLSGLTVANGSAGGIVNNGGTLTVSSCTISGNSGRGIASISGTRECPPHQARGDQSGRPRGSRREDPNKPVSA
jgi:hypothetical protein